MSRGSIQIGISSALAFITALVASTAFYFTTQAETGARLERHDAQIEAIRDTQQRTLDKLDTIEALLRQERSR